MPMTTGQRETQLRQQEAYVGFVSLQHIMGTTTKFEVEGWRVKEGITGGLVLYFPPNSPKFLPELIRAQTHSHLAVNIAYKSTETSPIIPDSLTFMSARLSGLKRRAGKLRRATQPQSTA